MPYTFSEDSYSDLHKDAYGFRPSQDDYIRWDKMTNDEKQATWDRMVADLERSIEEEKAIEQRCIEAFEQSVARTMTAGAADREEAIKWLIQAADVDCDVDFFCYTHGLPYNYFTREQDK